MSDQKPKNILRQLRSDDDDDAEKRVLYVCDEPAAVYQDESCDRREYRLLETNRRGTWYPDARRVEKSEMRDYLEEYEGSFEWISDPPGECERFPDPENP